jgi:hypothetical protein
MKRLINFLLTPWHKWKAKRAFEKRLKELRERDPFIYK